MKTAITPPTAKAVMRLAVHEGDTRAAVVRLLLERGPITAGVIGEDLGLTAAGVRRHLDALIEEGLVESHASSRLQQRGRGRPAKLFQLTAAGRNRLDHAYDDLASAALRHLREVGGDEAINEFAARRVSAILAGVQPVGAEAQPVGDGQPGEPDAVADKVTEIAQAFTDSGFAASARTVGTGLQLCQHHCPVSHVAQEFPELCEAELAAFSTLLDTHVQRLATIANGDCACTTHIPLSTAATGAQPAPRPNATSKAIRKVVR